MHANQQEWLQLQQSHDQMEQHALWLKTVSLLTWLTLVFVQESLLIQVAAMLLFWYLESGWRTQQQRAAERLLALEQAMFNQQDIACRWQSSWLQQRPGVVGLLTDYLRAALKPTVAALYLLLLAASLFRHFH